MLKLEKFEVQRSAENKDPSVVNVIETSTVLVPWYRYNDAERYIDELRTELTKQFLGTGILVAVTPVDSTIRTLHITKRMRVLQSAQQAKEESRTCL